jgi:hypothetical protein
MAIGVGTPIPEKWEAETEAEENIIIVVVIVVMPTVPSEVTMLPVVALPGMFVPMFPIFLFLVTHLNDIARVFRDNADESRARRAEV